MLEAAFGAAYDQRQSELMWDYHHPHQALTSGAGREGTVGRCSSGGC